MMQWASFGKISDKKIFTEGIFQLEQDCFTSLFNEKNDLHKISIGAVYS